MGGQIEQPQSKAATSGPRLVPLLMCAVLAACGGGGGGGGGATTQSDDAPSPSLTFSASPSSVSEGESTTLSWSSTNTDSCRASGGWSGDRAVSGSETISNLQSTQTFSLSCSGEGGGVLRDVVVDVVGDGEVTVNLTADRLDVRAGEQVTLTWDSSSATSCEASGDWSGDQSLSGTFTTPPLTEDSNFRLTCFAQAQSAVSQVGVNVVDPTVSWQPATTNEDGTPFDDLTGFTVYWGSSSRNYTSSVSLGPNTREYTLDLAAGTYYVAITSTNSLDEESDYSNEVRKQLP